MFVAVHVALLQTVMQPAHSCYNPSGKTVQSEAYHLKALLARDDCMVTTCSEADYMANSILIAHRLH